MQIQDFEYLLAVAGHGHLGRAAQALGISQPAMTKAVRRIETDAGLALFSRTPTGMALTEAGAAFTQRAQRIWMEYQDAIREMQQMRGGELGLLRVGFSPSVKEALVLPALEQLLGERPVARLVLRERLIAELIQLLQAGELDLILGSASERNDDASLSYQPLYADQLYVACDRHHILLGQGARSLQDLAAQAWLLPGANVRVRRWIANTFRAHGLPPPLVRVEAEYGRVSVWPLVRGSTMLCLCSESNLLQARANGLERLVVPELELVREIGVITRAGGHLSPLAQRLIEVLAARAAQGAA